MTNLVNKSPRQLGSELNLGPLGYGCWRLVNMPVADARARIEQALSCGMNLIDTADVYGLDWGGTAFGSAEELLGKVLVDALLLQYQGFSISASTQKNISDLEHSKTFTVVTGHQLNLFTGPLYFLYKITP